MELFKLKDGKIAARWGARDSASIARQLQTAGVKYRFKTELSTRLAGQTVESYGGTNGHRNSHQLFRSPAGREAEFFTLWQKVNAYMRTKPGYVSHALHRALAPGLPDFT